MNRLQAWLRPSQKLSADTRKPARGYLGTLQVAVAVVVLPATSNAVALMVYIRPFPEGDRSTRNCTVPPLIMMSPGTSPPPVPLSGSLLEAVTINDDTPDKESAAVT